MKSMQQAQPLIKELQEKYKDDKEKMNKELMELYKRIGFNPISGCLPMLLQLPIFIILFRVLRYPDLNNYILVNTSFFGMDLTSSAITKLSSDLLVNIHAIMPGMIDLSFIGISFLKSSYLYTPALVVVALMVVTTIIQQMMMTVDPQQKSTMWMMNIFIIYFAFMMPTGVLLYWGASNVLQFAQQALTKTPSDKNGGIKKQIDAAAAKSGSAKGKKETSSKDNISKQLSEDTAKKSAAASGNKAGSKKKKKRRKKK